MSIKTSLHTSPKFLPSNCSFPRRFNLLRSKRALRQRLRRDSGGQIEGLPLFWVGLGREGEGPHAGFCGFGAHKIANDRSQMRKQAAKAQGGRAVGEARDYAFSRVSRKAGDYSVDAAVRGILQGGRSVTWANSRRRA